jgi:hypothetical protein
MDTIQREFFRSARGPEPADVDIWRLVFDPATVRLVVRHEWEATRNGGVDEFEVAEFLMQDSAATAALKDLLFGQVTADA